MRIVVLIAVIVLLLAGGSVYFVSQRAPDKVAKVESGNPIVGSMDVHDPYDVVVSFDGEKFEPRELTVQKGTRVRFINESDTGVWPASAIHPTHSIYPEKDATNCLGSSFDSCRELKRDEFLDFTFNYEGEWRYHDHVQAFKTGIIIVTP